jgi:hypothetical protein
MRHGLYQQIVAWARGLVSQIHQHNKQLPLDQRQQPPNTQAIVNTVISYIHRTRDKNPANWIKPVKRTLKVSPYL